MRKSILLLCTLSLGTSGCAPPTHDTLNRSREERAYPSATLGTENAESQWYRTQTIAPPSAQTVPGASTDNAPARSQKSPVPTHPKSAGTKSTGTSQPVSPTQ